MAKGFKCKEISKSKYSLKYKIVTINIVYEKSMIFVAFLVVISIKSRLSWLDKRLFVC